MAIRYPLVLNGSSIQELQDGDTLNASSNTAVNATNAQFLLVDGMPMAAEVDTASLGTPNTIPARDESGNINATLFQGVATSALFADLAEKYLPDQTYETGTVVIIGGTAEITSCNKGDRAFGAISENPAYMMNSGLEGGVYVALKGRVPVKVEGPVKKGDKLIASDNGTAAEASTVLRSTPISAGTFPDTFAIAMEDNANPGVKLVESVIL